MLLKLHIEVKEKEFILFIIFVLSVYYLSEELFKKH